MITALLTDLGTRDPYVASMKGIILGIAPNTHNSLTLPIRSPATMSAKPLTTCLSATATFPAQTVFCCVVDPGVGE